MAERIIANLTLDTYQRNKIPPLVIPQHDYGARYIRVRITEQGENVSVASGSVVSIIAKRMADGQSAAFSGSVNADGSVLVPATQWMLDAPSDDVDCHVAVTGNGYQYSTTSFVISPQERENPSYLEEDDPRVNIVEEALIKVVEEADRAEEQADLAQSAASTAASDAKEAARQEVEQLVGQLGIVQTLGNSRMAVVSQEVTTGLYNRNAKRIANLEQGFNEQFETDDSVAYVKDVPENALPYAEVKKVGGMTYKDGDTLRSAKVTEVESVGANLFDFEKWKETLGSSNAILTFGENSITITANGGDAFAVSDAVKVPVIGGEEYTIYFDKTPSDKFTVCYAFKNGEINPNTLKQYYSSPFTFLADENAEFYTLRFGVSDAGDSVTFSNIGMCKGSTAQPYTPYLHHTLPIPVEVRGSENLFSPLIKGVHLNPENGSQGVSDTSATTDYIPVHMSGGDYCISGLPNNLWYFVAFYDSNKNFINRTGAGPNVSTYESLVDLAGQANVDPSRVSYIRITMYENSNTSGSITSIDNLKLMMNRGTTPMSYEPYSTVKGLDGYGLGVSDTVYNYIDWEKKQFVKRCAMVDLETLEWSYGSGLFVSHDLQNLIKKATDNSTIANIITSKYSNTSRNGVNTMDKSICCDPDGDLDVNDSSYTDAETFKASMSGVMLVYELATPEVTDISSLITEDNFIGVEGNGTLTFKNAYEYSVPSEVEYQLEV